MDKKQNISPLFVGLCLVVFLFLTGLTAFMARQGVQNHFETFEGTDGVEYRMSPHSYFAVLTRPADNPDDIPGNYEAKTQPGQHAVVDKMGWLFYDAASYGTITRGDAVCVDQGKVSVNGRERHPNLSFSPNKATL